MAINPFRFEPKPDPTYSDRERHIYVAGYSDAFNGRPYLTSWDRWEGVPINPAYAAGWNYAKGNTPG